MPAHHQTPSPLNPPLQPTTDPATLHHHFLHAHTATAPSPKRVRLDQLRPRRSRGRGRGRHPRGRPARARWTGQSGGRPTAASSALVSPTRGMRELDQAGARVGRGPLGPHAGGQAGPSRPVRTGTGTNALWGGLRLGRRGMRLGILLWLLLCSHLHLVVARRRRARNDILVLGPHPPQLLRGQAAVRARGGVFVGRRAGGRRVRRLGTMVVDEQVALLTAEGAAAARTVTGTGGKDLLMARRVGVAPAARAVVPQGQVLAVAGRDRGRGRVVFGRGVGRARRGEP
jgi:hypothetical protein